MSTILIIGRGFTPLKQAITLRGYEYLVLRDVRTVPESRQAGKKEVLCDFTSVGNVIETVEKIRTAHQFAGVITIYENYILPAAQIAKHLELPGIPISAAQACTDKYLMRSLFVSATEKISPDFKEVKNLEDASRFAETHTFPLILKPANLAKSLLVSKVNSLQELIGCYQAMVKKVPDVYKKYAPNSAPKIIIEEFMEGSIHSVDAFVDNHGTPHVLEQVVDYQTGYDIGYDDNFHYSRILPSKLPLKSINDIRKTAVIGCNALGMKNSPAHIEIILTSEGPRIVEIGARNGGYRERMHGAANGIDILGNALDLALGKMPNIRTSRNDPCAVLELFPKIPGIFEGIAHEKELRELPSLSYFQIKNPTGQHVGKSSDGYKMSAIIMLHNPDVDQFQKDLDFINKHVFVKTLRLQES